MNSLNELQGQAVALQGAPLIIFAPPGSGKTHVISMKIRKFVLEMNVPPDKVLAVSFTNKASNELKHRVAEMCNLDPSDFHNICTFHSLCLKLLKKYADKTPLMHRNFLILDSDDSTRIIKDLLYEAVCEAVAQGALPPATMQNFKTEKDALAKKVIKFMDTSWRNHGIEPYDVARNEKFVEFARILYCKYRSKCLASNVVDFNDILTHTVTMLQNHPDVLDECRRQSFWYLLVDEFQDTNPVQMKLVHTLVGRSSGGRLTTREGEEGEEDEGTTLIPEHLTVVGDDYQAIYKFRGSTIRNILDFTEMYPTAKRIVLSVNYRSLKGIIDASSSLILNNTQQVQKEVVSGRIITAQKVVTKLIYPNAEMESLELVRLCESSESQIAVLTRTNMCDTDFIPTALRRAGIKYRILGNGSFFLRKEVRGAIALCAFLQHPELFDHALQTCIEMHACGKGIGPVTLNKIKRVAKERGINMWSACKTYCTSNKFVRKMIEELTPLIVVAESLRENSAKEFMNAVYSHHEEIHENVKSLIDLAPTNCNISDFIDQCRIHYDSENHDGNEEPPRVIIMTAHKSKGLEFPIVFLPGCIEGTYPSFYAYSREDVEEERRLFFVAMTRARDHLYISIPGMNLSRFVKEF